MKMVLQFLTVQLDKLMPFMERTDRKSKSENGSW